MSGLTVEVANDNTITDTISRINFTARADERYVFAVYCVVATTGFFQLTWNFNDNDAVDGIGLFKNCPVLIYRVQSELRVV